ncbi:GntR family transcriptional regulator [Bacillus sp. KH172YL63]|uniref:GntR family transcriptional regulator n=1 Tax=Bacillus sp. KH172YL63 TaxID=2709784 RepID=UPI0013E4E333|nr:GntR family transcriptional regulator [Bacillus sp. KH172YL63]BCB02742.1 GntR family transcriptional regulator [Bacillus sp. KH172YL63]
MILDSNSMKPIYIQLSEWLETEILSGNFLPDDKVYSQYQLAEMYNINPATAAKGLTILADEGVLYKKRGLGMFVSSSARSIILKKRKDQTLVALVKEVVKEAVYLNVTEKDLITMIHEEMKAGDSK